MMQNCQQQDQNYHITSVLSSLSGLLLHGSLSSHDALLTSQQSYILSACYHGVTQTYSFFLNLAFLAF